MFLRSSLLLLVIAARCFAASEENVTKQFDARADGKLIVDVDCGTIDIAPGADGKVAIEAHREITSANEEREKEYFAATPLLISQDGETITIRAQRNEQHHSWSWNGNVTMDARYTVRLPKSFNVDLHTGGGAIIAGEITGTMKAKTNGGKLRFNGWHGSIEAKTNGGNVEISGCAGPTQLATNGGKIEVNDGSGSLDAKTSGGSVEVRNQAGDAIVQTSGGRLKLDNVSGNLVGKTSGGSITAVLARSVPGDVKLETSAGSIDVVVPATAALNIDAQAHSGRVHCALASEPAQREEGKLRATVNGGGKALILHSGAGSITIKPSSAEMAGR